MHIQHADWGRAARRPDEPVQGAPVLRKGSQESKVSWPDRRGGGETICLGFGKRKMLASGAAGRVAWGLVIRP